MPGRRRARVRVRGHRVGLSAGAQVIHVHAGLLDLTTGLVER
ncbi:hypothetical protein [Winogradskya consettensis]|nr:hypothetical protein [Actinoplanes consettensis]